MPGSSDLRKPHKYRTVTLRGYGSTAAGRLVSYSQTLSSISSLINHRRYDPGDAQLISSPESHVVEWKRSTGQRTDGAKTACAFLNGEGGHVLFGVEPNGSICGQEVGATTLDDVAAELRRIDPQVPIHPEVVPLASGKSVVVLNVPAGSGGPYRYDGRPYVRMGPSTVLMGREEFERRVVARREPGNRWECQPAVIGVDALDTPEILRTTEEAIRRGRLNEPGTRDPLELLRGLGLVSGDTIINAAAALFARGDRLLPGYPQCQLRMARFRGTTTAEFEDNRQASGHIFELILQAQTFLRTHLPVSGRIVPSLFERIDDPLYPLEALREALAGAIHRAVGTGTSERSIRSALVVLRTLGLVEVSGHARGARWTLVNP